MQEWQARKGDGLNDVAVGIGGVGRGQMAEKQSLGKRWEMESGVGMWLEMQRCYLSLSYGG